MKNYEKYADEIREYVGTDFCGDFVKPHILKEISCTNISCGKCRTLQLLWLLEDYKEPETDWSKVAVDTPILVRNSEDGEWIRRHFFKHEGGIVYAWDFGRTSWTELNDENVTGWKYAKLTETEGAEWLNGEKI